MKLIFAATCVAAISLAFMPGADAKGCTTRAAESGEVKLSSRQIPSTDVAAAAPNETHVKP
ncbi:hypothetical protein [Bradyrhizobium sp. AZCC 2230]|uniref:hypothetical protein n=1 Tax=Bradyrhizobium sp. AZCC 2230 TaxID=3117021 RepID=UPI002FEF08B4